MPRPRKNAVAPTDAPTDFAASELAEELQSSASEAANNGGDAAAPAVKRRRRRKSLPTALVNELSDANALVAALLQSRGEQGATQDDFHVVVAWARGIRDEGTALNTLSARPRQQKTMAPTERLTRYEMNRALLDGVIEGSIGLDVVEDGTLRFVSQQVAPPPPAAADDRNEEKRDAADAEEAETNGSENG